MMMLPFLSLKSLKPLLKLILINRLSNCDYIIAYEIGNVNKEYDKFSNFFAEFLLQNNLTKLLRFI